MAGQTGSSLFTMNTESRTCVTAGSFLSSSLSSLLPFRIPLKKFRSVRRELTDSGRKVEELLADRLITKYNYGFPSSGAPTPEALTNYLDVSAVFHAAEPRPGLWLQWGGF